MIKNRTAGHIENNCCCKIRKKDNIFYALSFHQVVCQSCSSNKYCLEYLKNQSARVCEQCYLILQQQKSKSGFLRPLFSFWSKHTVIFIFICCLILTHQLWNRHRHTLYSPYFLCIEQLHVPHFCSSGEQALSAAVSPGNRATFAFPRKQKKIPAALKEVTDAFSWSRGTVIRW